MSSVCSSVCLSVTLVDHDHIDWISWKLTAQTISPSSPFFIAQRSSTYSQGNMEKFWGRLEVGLALVRSFGMASGPYLYCWIILLLHQYCTTKAHRVVIFAKVLSRILSAVLQTSSLCTNNMSAHLCSHTGVQSAPWTGGGPLQKSWGGAQWKNFSCASRHNSCPLFSICFWHPWLLTQFNRQKGCWAKILEKVTLNGVCLLCI